MVHKFFARLEVITGTAFIERKESEQGLGRGAFFKKTACGKKAQSGEDNYDEIQIC